VYSPPIARAAPIAARLGWWVHRFKRSGAVDAGPGAMSAAERLAEYRGAPWTLLGRGGGGAAWLVSRRVDGAARVCRFGVPSV
jgi:hypothetical protein